MPHNPRRHGVSALLAMMYLVLFSTMAVGFYATTNTAVQVAHNDQKITRALLAAECGMDFMRYQMSQVVVPAATKQDRLFANLTTCLKNQIDGTANVAGKQIYANSEIIRIPASPGEYIKLDNEGSEFRVSIHNRGHKVLVTVHGRHYDTASMSRGVQMEFGIADEAHEIFDYGIATKGSIATSGNGKVVGAVDPTKGSILATSLTAATPVNIQGPLVSGDISVTNPAGVVTVKAGASVGGTADPAKIDAEHVHKGVAEPEFPVIDTDLFKPFVTDPLTGLPRYYIAGKLVENMVIRANTNPTFAGGVTIRGVCYIEAPNNVKFQGDCIIQGVIVGPNAPIGNLATNIVSFAGNATVTGVETLPDTFGELKKLTGSFLLTPGFAANFTGAFGTVNGSMVADKFTFAGNAGGTIKGSLINMKDNLMSVGGSSEVVIAGNGTNNFPAGVYFKQKYESLPDTYEELR